MGNLRYGYVIINKFTNLCQQTLKTNNSNFSVNDDEVYSMAIDISYVEEYLNKYYYDSTWFTRVWSETDEFGEPVEGATYTDIQWTAGA